MVSENLRRQCNIGGFVLISVPVSDVVAVLRSDKQRVNERTTPKGIYLGDFVDYDPYLLLIGSDIGAKLKEIAPSVPGSVGWLRKLHIANWTRVNRQINVDKIRHMGH